MNKVKICLIGAGRVGQLDSYIYSEYIPEASLVAIVDSDISKSEGLANKYNITGDNVFNTIEKAIENVKFDAVVIATRLASGIYSEYI